MAGINFLGIKSGSSQSKAHRYLAAKRQSMQIPCREKARHIDILLRQSKVRRYLAAKKQGTQVSYCEFARKFKALKSLNCHNALFSATRCVFFALCGYFATLIWQRICHFERSEKSKEFTIHFDFMDTSLRSV